MYCDISTLQQLHALASLPSIIRDLQQASHSIGVINKGAETKRFWCDSFLRNPTAQRKQAALAETQPSLDHASE